MEWPLSVCSSRIFGFIKTCSCWRTGTLECSGSCTAITATVHHVMLVTWSWPRLESNNKLCVCVCVCVCRVSVVSLVSPDSLESQDSRDLKVRLDPEEKRFVAAFQSTWTLKWQFRGRESRRSEDRNILINSDSEGCFPFLPCQYVMNS